MASEVDCWEMMGVLLAAKRKVTVTAFLFLLFIATPAIATPLHSAAEHNDFQTAKTLIAQGENINAADDYQDTPLHKAAQHNARETAALLLGSGAAVNVRNQFGATPLHYAAANNAHTIAAMLLSNGADIHAADKLTHQPLHWAARANAGAVADLLTGRGADDDKVSGWHWFYNDHANAESWRRGKAWFDEDMREFLAREKKRTALAEQAAKEKNIAFGAVRCAGELVVGSSTGCAQAINQATLNIRRETAWIKQWEAMLGQIGADESVHNARFLVPPNEQARPVTVNGVQPFPRYVAKLTHADGACTAFLVRPKIAMTNSHCVCRDEQCKRKITPREIKLTFARRDLTGKHDITVAARKVYAYDYSQYRQNDFAFLVLTRPPNLDGYLEVANDLADTRSIATAGYPGDLLNGKVMTAFWGCGLRRRAQGILYFAARECHNYKGASGSPYIAVDGKHRGKVVGINSFTWGNTAATGGGPEVGQFYARLREVIRAEE